MNLILDYITETEERFLIDKILKDHEHLDFGKTGGKRSGIYRYGLKKHHPDRLVSESIPDYLKLEIGEYYNSVTINEYNAGDIIDWHIDKRKLGDTISIISLMSDSTLLFREKANKSNIKEYLLPRRSLFKMNGEMRYTWEHYLRAEQKRISIIYRNIE